MIVDVVDIKSELKGVPAEMLVKLIPDHAKKQCGFLGSSS